MLADPFPAADGAEPGAVVKGKAGQVLRADPSLQEHVRQLSVDGASVLIVEQRARAVLGSPTTPMCCPAPAADGGQPAALTDSKEFVDSFLGGGRIRTGIPPDCRAILRDD
jgi:hypothetical protein